MRSNQILIQYKRDLEPPNPYLAKLFLVCARSWELNGWEPIRYDAVQCSLARGFSGVLKNNPIPRWFWRHWATLKYHTPCWIAETDCLNYNFAPPPLPDIPDGSAMVFSPPGSTYVWLCLMFITSGFCDYVMETMDRVDRGEAIMVAGPEFINDERMVSEHCQSRLIRGGPEIGLPYYSWKWEEKKIQHYGCAVIDKAIEAIPVVY